MITDTKEIAKRLRIEADYWRNYRKDNVVFDVPNYLFSDSVLMAFGVNGIDEMDMPVYELFDKLADIIDSQERQSNSKILSIYRNIGALKVV